MARFHALTRLHVRGELRRAGFGFGKINEAIAAASDDVIDTVADEAGVFAKVGAFGDGSIIEAIIAWFKSEEGKAFIAMLIKLIIGLL